MSLDDRNAIYDVTIVLSCLNGDTYRCSQPILWLCFAVTPVTLSALR
jgi:hypothetical protein